MEFWLMQDNDKFQLPISPESFEISKGKNNSTINVASGEINILGKSKLDSISISSFFPAQEYYFCDYIGFPDPYDCVDLVEKFMLKGQVRLLITGTNINKIFYIENFSYGEKDGTGDVYYTIEFKEYKKNKIVTLPSGTSIQTKNPNPNPPPKPTSIKSSNNSSSSSSKSRKSTKTTKTTKKTSTKKKEKSSRQVPKTHKVKKGETASSISRKYYGSSSKAYKLLKNNNLTSAKQIKVGMVLKI